MDSQPATSVLADSSRTSASHPSTSLSNKSNRTLPSIPLAAQDGSHEQNGRPVPSQLIGHVTFQLVQMEGDSDVQNLEFVEDQKNPRPTTFGVR